MVRLVKEHTKRTFRRALLNLDEITTVLTEIEATVNSRPLTYTYDNPQELSPITPSLLLTGKNLTNIPEPLREEQEANVGNIQAATRRMEYRNMLMQRFWMRWRTEYLQELIKCSKKFTATNPPRIDDVCLIEDNMPRQTWKLGVIRRLITGNDGLVRAALVKTKQGWLNRPIQRLYPLEGDDNTQQNE